MAVMTKDLDAADPKRSAELTQRAGAVAAMAQVKGLAAKRWGDLMAEEKDAVQKVIAIRLGLVAPD